MIVININGGLGNQLFQFALGQALAIKHGSVVYFDASKLGKRSFRLTSITPRMLDIVALAPGINEASMEQVTALTGLGNWKLTMERLASKANFNLFGHIHIEENPYHFDPAIFTCQLPSYLYGYWQSYKYFEFVRVQLHAALDLKPRLVIPGLAVVPDNAVAIHIRRGDYVGHNNHRLVSREYYLQAVASVEQELDSKILPVIYSDDIEWCKLNLPEILPHYKLVFVNLNDPIEEFRSMTLFRNYIIANSTFSWWAAWLSQKPGKTVIAPSQWIDNIPFKKEDFFPSDWKVL